MKTLLVDVDGVLCNFADTYLAMLNSLTGRSHTSLDITSWHFDRCVASAEEDQAVWRQIANSEDLVYELPEYPETGAFLEAMRRKYRVVAVTAPAWDCPHWMPGRADWLRRRGFSTKDIVFCSDKRLVDGHIFIDDHPENVASWYCQRYNCQAFLVHRPWNQGMGFSRWHMKQLTELLSYD